MAGFRSVKEVCSTNDLGKVEYCFFRKVPPASAVTIAGQWFDYSTASGIPLPNYYASEPLKAAYIDAEKGLPIRDTVSPDKRYLRTISTMTGASGVTVTTSQNQHLILLDYLMYYPFFDLDAVAEVQSTIGTNTLTRYATAATGGHGVQMMMVSQAATAGSGSFTVTYTNSDGTPGRVTPTIYCPAAQPSGALVSANATALGVSPFLPLQGGDKGVRSVQSMTMIGANGGLGCIALVKPLQHTFVNEECRRASTTPVESQGDCFEIQRIRRQAGMPEIKEGAVLGFIGKTTAGTIASSQLIGYLDLVWG